MRLGAVHMDEMVNAIYRVVVPMTALSRRGHDVIQVIEKRGTPLPIEQLLDCDLVHIHRLLLVDDEDDCVERLLDAGVAVGFDDDDNSEAAPPELLDVIPGDAAGILERSKRDFQRLLARAPKVDLVTTPGPGIADRFERAGAANVEIIDNFLPDQFLEVRSVGHEGIVIGWHAAAEHQLDVDALELRPVFEDLLDVHPDLHVVTIGTDLDLGIEHERYRREEGVRFDHLTQRLADVDVGIVPLSDTPFNQGRSNVKAREYAAAGVPWLASPVGPYAELGEDEGGRLVEDDGWFDALDELVRDKRARRKQGKRARSWAERETISRMAWIWEEAFVDAIYERDAA